MNNEISKKILWFFCDYDGTYNKLEKDKNKIIKLLQTLNEIRKYKNLDLIAFNFASSNPCEYLHNIFLDLHTILHKSDSNIADKDKFVLFSALGTDGYMIAPCSKNSKIINATVFKPKGEKIYNIVSKTNFPGEIIYADDCPIFNLTVLEDHLNANPIPGINEITFIGYSEDNFSDLPNSFNIVRNNSEDFVLKGLEEHLNELSKQQER